MTGLPPGISCKVNLYRNKSVFALDSYDGPGKTVTTLPVRPKDITLAQFT